MVDELPRDREIRSKPPLPRFSLKALLVTFSAASAVLALGVAFLPKLLGPDYKSILFIIGFASYPVLTAVAAEYIGRFASDRRFTKIGSFIAGTIGVVPAILLNYPRPQVYMVAPIAGLVLVLCCTATGAFVGSLVDLWKSFSTSRE